jgi:hypothetical protein
MIRIARNPARALRDERTRRGPLSHRSDLLRQAAQQAGLPESTVVAEPIAAAAYAASLTTITPGGCVLVCDIGHRTTEVSVVQRDTTAWTVLATRAVPAATGEALHQAITTRLLAQHPDAASNRQAVDNALPAALTTLSAGQPAAMVLPGAQAPIVIGPDDLDAIIEPLRRAIGTAIMTVVDAADINPDMLATAVILGGPAGLIRPADLITARFAVTVLPVDELQLALPYGALQLRQPAHIVDSTPIGSDITAALDWRSLKYRRMIPALLAILAGPLIVTLELDFLNNEAVTWRHEVEYGKLSVFFNANTFAAAGLFSTLGTIAMGVFVAAACQADDASNATPGRTAGLAGRAVALSAGFGIVVAALAGLVADSIFGHIAGLAPNFLAATLAAAAIPAGLAIAIGILAPLIPAIRRNSWASRLRQPMSAALLAAAGIALMSIDSNPRGPLWSWVEYGLPLHLGALIGPALLGIATACTLLNGKITRTILAAVLAIGYSTVYGFHSARLLVLIYLVVVALWWIRQTILIGYDALPPGLLNRVVTNAGASAGEYVDSD